MSLKIQTRTSLVIGFTAAILFSTHAVSAPSAADCAARADRAQRGSGSAMGGVGRGAARGAIFGGIVGGSDAAKRGAALGGIVGGVKKSRSSNETYNRVYDDCMAGQ